MQIRPWRWIRSTVRESLADGLAGFLAIPVLILAIPLAGLFYVVSSLVQWMDQKHVEQWSNFEPPEKRPTGFVLRYSRQVPKLPESLIIQFDLGRLHLRFGDRSRDVEEDPDLVASLPQSDLDALYAAIRENRFFTLTGRTGLERNLHAERISVAWPGVHYTIDDGDTFGDPGAPEKAAWENLTTTIQRVARRPIEEATDLDPEKKKRLLAILAEDQERAEEALHGAKI